VYQSNCFYHFGINLYFQEMKALLYNAKELAPAAEVVEPEITARYYAQFDEQFFHFCEKELVKINTFYNGKDQ